MKGTFTLLGTGSSMGVPVIGCRCAVCLSDHPKNNRTRSGALVEFDGKRILIDASQDFRMQALKEEIECIDGVIFTHGHHDHTAGLDDLRVYKKMLPAAMSEETYRDLSTRYPYIFKRSKKANSLIAQFETTILSGDQGKIDFCGIECHYFTFYQLGMQVNGLRFGNLAYVSDIKQYSEEIFKELVGVDTLILSALQHEPSRIHLSIDEAIAFSRRVETKEVWLTHIAHKVDYETTNAALPDRIQLSYDGLRLPFEI